MLVVWGGEGEQGVCSGYVGVGMGRRGCLIGRGCWNSWGCRCPGPLL